MSKKFLLLTAALLAVVLLSGCTGGSVRGNTWPGLSASGDVAYLADGPFVYAVDIKDGSELWRYPAQRDNKLLFYTTPYITSEGTIIVGSSGSNASLLALTPNGKEAWSYTGTRYHWVAAPLQIDNYLYAPNSDGSLYVFDMSDGQTNKQPVKVIELATDLWAQPVTDGKNLYISALDHSLIALDKDTLQTIWHVDLGSAITSPPILASDGSLYVGSFASKLEKFDPATGDHETVEKSKDWVWGTPAELENNLYFGDLGGNFYFYNLETGEYSSNSILIKPDNYDPASSKDVDESRYTAITASPLVVNNALLVATESGALYQVDQEGKYALWGGQQPGGKIYTTPILAGDLVLVSPMNSGAFLYAYDLNGNQKWSFMPAN